MHLAVTHRTAAEIVYERADSEMPHMGLTLSLIHIYLMKPSASGEIKGKTRMLLLSLHTLLQSIKVRAAILIRFLWYCPKPVSYTHLDVYKRQVSLHII